ncbi:hypothetical protein H696_05624 [Fonticula alba]|uniref:HTH La-type RNA-binding domain-containing protein n=1 Tax=Fonticula alba TaxID=691883 RepID=A0A058Z0W2_FONAL|nr:hypothetical protein H696_05624 [Fonticula alba]KCV67895.1 hypothetical protein H696_05624 [Fonticula alba]|eukprot:XP_009497715.1 hypothetical protein H696_05624 [Fonticula alba]
MTSAQTTPPAAFDGESSQVGLLGKLEYFFSVECLSQDHNLASKMDNDLFIPVAEILALESVKALGTSEEEILSTLKTSAKVTVDEAGKRIRPNEIEPCTMILTDVDEAVTEKDILDLLASVGCTEVASITTELNRTRFVTFKSPADLKLYYRKVISETLLGSRIYARVKDENTFKHIKNSSYVLVPKPAAAGAVGGKSAAHVPGVPVANVYKNGQQHYSFPTYYVPSGAGSFAAGGRAAGEAGSSFTGRRGPGGAGGAGAAGAGRRPAGQRRQNAPAAGVAAGSTSTGAGAGAAGAPATATRQASGAGGSTGGAPRPGRSAGGQAAGGAVAGAGTGATAPRSNTRSSNPRGQAAGAGAAAGSGTTGGAGGAARAGAGGAGAGPNAERRNTRTPAKGAAGGAGRAANSQQAAAGAGAGSGSGAAAPPKAISITADAFPPLPGHSATATPVVPVAVSSDRKQYSVVTSEAAKNPKPKRTPGAAATPSTSASTSAESSAASSPALPAVAETAATAAVAEPVAVEAAAPVTAEAAAAAAAATPAAAEAAAV